MTKNKHNSGQSKLKKLISECYLISRNIHTSYNEILKITPTERKILLELIYDEIKRTDEKTKQVISEAKSRQQSRK